MSNGELVGRIAALEVIAMTALGLHLANARHDPESQASSSLGCGPRSMPKRQLCPQKRRNMQPATVTISWMP
jgi:hypothetical protein